MVAGTQYSVSTPSTLIRHLASHRFQHIIPMNLWVTFATHTEIRNLTWNWAEYFTIIDANVSQGRGMVGRGDTRGGGESIRITADCFMIISRQLSEFIGEGKHKLRPESRKTATPPPAPPSACASSPYRVCMYVCIDWAALGLIDAHTSYSISINGLIRNQFV